MWFSTSNVNNVTTIQGRHWSHRVFIQNASMSQLSVYTTSPCKYYSFFVNSSSMIITQRNLDDLLLFEFLQQPWFFMSLSLQIPQPPKFSTAPSVNFSIGSEGGRVVVTSNHISQVRMVRVSWFQKGIRIQLVWHFNFFGWRWRVVRALGIWHS